jgi:ketosteroid isomerase-like protein
MSESNIEVVRRGIEAFSHDEAAWLATMDPTFEWYPIEEGHSPSHGLDSAKRVRDRWLESFEAHQIEIEALSGNGEHVVSSIHIRGRGRESGVAVDIRIHMHWKLRSGKLVYLYEHGDRTEALRAAGLEE